MIPDVEQYIYAGLLVLDGDMSSENDSALMAYVKRRRAINRRAAAKSRAKLKEHATHVKQVNHHRESETRISCSSQSCQLRSAGADLGNCR